MTLARVRIALAVAFWLVVAASSWVRGVSQTVSLTVDRTVARRYQVVNAMVTVPAGMGGTVEFFDATRALLTVPVSPGGRAVLSIASLGRGVHSLGAMYQSGSGDAAKTNAVEVLVTGSEVALQPLEPAQGVFAGKQFRLSLRGLPPRASGTVTVLEAGSVLGTLQLAPASDRAWRTGAERGAGPAQDDAAPFLYQPGADVGPTARLAGVAWLAIPREYKRLPGEREILTSGDWALRDGALQNASGEGSLTIPITTSGGPIYLWCEGPLRVSIDGVAVAGSLRFPVEPGPHQVVVSGAGRVLGAGTPPSAGDASVHPEVVVAGMVREGQMLARDGLAVRDFDGAETPVAAAPLTRSPKLEVTLTEPGKHHLRVEYSGDATYAPAAGSLDVHVKPRAQSRVTFTTATTSYPANAPVTLTASVAPATATGSIVFVEGGLALGSASLTAGSAPVSLTLTPGVHSVAASYSGDADDDPAVSPEVQIKVVPGPVTVTLTPLPTEMMAGIALTLEATVAPSAAGGAVTFQDAFTAAGAQIAQTTPLGQAPLASGSARWVAEGSLPGTHIFTANYAGDDRDLAAVSPALVVIVDAIATTTTLAPVADSTYGSPMKLAATVAPGGSGTVVFRDSVSGLLGQSIVTAGAAALTAGALAPGLHTFTATYTGDATHAGSTSAGVAATVRQVGTTTLLTASASAVDAGATVTVTAAVTPSGASGAVVMRDANGVLGQALLRDGTAVLTLPGLAVGTHNISAEYAGDTYFAASTSATVMLRVDALATSLSIAAPASLGYGGSLTLTATVLPASVTGPITFADNGKPVGSAPALAGVASLTLTGLPVGSHSLTASYAGDSSHAGSTSAAAVTAVTQNATTTTAWLAETSVPAGGVAVLNVAVTCACPAVPVGTASVGGVTAPLANGATGMAYATLPLPAQALGSFTVTVTYGGDANFLGSSAAPLTYRVVPTPTAGTLTLSSSQVAIGTRVVLSAAFSAAGQVPVGSAIFRSGSTTLATVTLDGAGAASTAFAPGIGVYGISVEYVPGPLFATTVVPGQTLTVTAPLAISLDPATVAVNAGATAGTVLVVTPLSGYQGPATAVCASPVKYVTCSVEAPGSIAGPVQLKVVVSAASKLTPGLLLRGAILLLPLALLHRRRVRALAVLLLLSVAGCASGGEFQNLPAGPVTLTLQVSANGVTASAPLSVNVSD